MESFTRQSFEAGQFVLTKRSSGLRKAQGQFLTRTPIAQFMANQLGTIADGGHLLDPAMGSGTLLCAVIDRVMAESTPLELWIDGFELDKELHAVADSVLQNAVAAADEHGIKIHLRLFHADFVLNGLQFLRPSLLRVPVGRSHYQHIIANPPYFKISNEDSRRRAAQGLLSGHTNIYTLFMGLAAHMLRDGNACFIVPRSFCSGAYFTRFRRDFLEQATVQRVHLFEARDDAFNEDDVLQENVVITFRPRAKAGDGHVQISSSASASVDILHNRIATYKITQSQFVSPLGLFRLPTSIVDETILSVVDKWTDSLRTYGAEISTGPVIPFRAKQHLLYEAGNTPWVPLLWMQHIKAQQVTWPLNDGFGKPQYMVCEPQLLVRNTNYVLLRRFSAKEEARRLVAAPFIAANFPFKLIGLENHLNYIYCLKREMLEEEAIGLAALLNSGLIDRYFRISNGNTQVNATELRALPLPPIAVIRAIGGLLNKDKVADLDDVVINILQEYKLVPPDLPIIRETRVV